MKNIKPKIWDGYVMEYWRERKERNTYLLIVPEKVKLENCLHLGILWNYRDDGYLKYYGIINPQKKRPIATNEYLQLERCFAGLGLTPQPDRIYLGWKYYDLTDNDLLKLGSDEEIYRHLEDWAATFWSLAEEVRSPLEAYNATIL